MSLFGEEEEDLAGELRDLQRDLDSDTKGDDMANTETTMELDGPEELSGVITRSRGVKRGLGLQGPALLQLLDVNGRPYPGGYSNPLLDLYGGDEPALERPVRMSKKREKRKRLFEPTMERKPTAKEPLTSMGIVSRRILSTNKEDG